MLVSHVLALCWLYCGVVLSSLRIVSRRSHSQLLFFPGVFTCMVIFLFTYLFVSLFFFHQAGCLLASWLGCRLGRQVGCSSSLQPLGHLTSICLLGINRVLEVICALNHLLITQLHKKSIILPSINRYIHVILLVFVVKLPMMIT